MIEGVSCAGAIAIAVNGISIFNPQNNEARSPTRSVNWTSGAVTAAGG